ncbi:hypothetical protein [Cytobacillus purgationiresistens]|uniref:Uncharacterized protein n=1 Tax=Cytobacillus purgationiresistens TaxID=863449 RepID=A0ABU0ASI8_9BACI|nr:hypothetical protein [Cytobacillus purgationiresistens]MDQ0273990.1 hypothetical protein [Cytobacillus purgationiresistens]
MKRTIIKTVTGEYKRTSSGGQDLELQTSSNVEFLNGIPSDEILTFTDFDVSATKLTMKERPAHVNPPKRKIQKFTPKSKGAVPKGS